MDGSDLVLHLEQEVFMDLGLDVVDQSQDVLDDRILVALDVAIHLLDLLRRVGVDLGGDSLARAHVLERELRTSFNTTAMTFNTIHDMHVHRKSRGSSLHRYFDTQLMYLHCMMGLFSSAKIKKRR